MSRVFVNDIDEGAHTADLKCGTEGCGWTDDGANVNTDVQVQYTENLEGVTINDNILSSVANVAALPAASGGSVDDLRHVVADDENGQIPAGGANIYVIVDDSGNVWKRVNGSVTVTCPDCGLASTYPMFDPRNVCGASLGRARDAGT